MCTGTLAHHEQSSQIEPCLQPAAAAAHPLPRPLPVLLRPLRPGTHTSNGHVIQRCLDPRIDMSLVTSARPPRLL